MRLEVNEMGTLRWMCGVRKKDKIREEHVGGSEKVAPITKNRLKKLNVYGHIKRREERHDNIPPF